MTEIFSETPAESVFNSLVGEGRQYQDPEALARGRIEADNHIKRLEREMADLRTELSTRTTVEDQLKLLNEHRETTNAPPRQAQPPAEGQRLDPQDLATRVRETLQQERANERVQTNIDQVATRLVETFGSVEKATEIVSAKARELGVSVKFLEGVAAQSPAAFYTQLGMVSTPRQTDTAPTRGDVNTGGLHAGGTQEGTWEFYTDLRRKNPNLYFSPKIQSQIHKAVEEGKFELPG